jgi:hypothetical protein
MHTTDGKRHGYRSTHTPEGRVGAALLRCATGGATALTFPAPSMPRYSMPDYSSTPGIGGINGGISDLHLCSSLLLVATSCTAPPCPCPGTCTLACSLRAVGKPYTQRHRGGVGGGGRDDACIRRTVSDTLTGGRTLQREAWGQHGFSALHVGQRP